MRIDPLWSPCGEAPAAPRAARPPLVVALHASASSARQWRTLAERLEGGHGLRVLAVDLHDHGTGPAWTSDGRTRPPLTLEDEAALVAPLLAEAGRVGDGGGVHLVGHSYGGAVALKVASQHPQHVRSLVLYEPVAFRLLLDDPASHAETAEALAVTAAMQTHMERGDRDGAARHFVDYWSGSGTWQAMPEPARDSVAERLPALLQHFGALFNERAQGAAVSRLAMPTLVLSGDRTVATARRIAHRLCALHAAATHETMPGLGHMGPVTHAERVAGRIAQHLEAMSHWAAPPPVQAHAPLPVQAHAPLPVQAHAPLPVQAQTPRPVQAQPQPGDAPAAAPPQPPFPAPVREPRNLPTVA
jgi:pimeloyl-ACP methyl ester carboxylesterase